MFWRREECSGTQLVLPASGQIGCFDPHVHLHVDIDRKVLKISKRFILNLVAIATAS